MRSLAVATLVIAAAAIGAEAKSPASDPLRGDAMAVCVREESGQAAVGSAASPTEICECALDDYLLGRRPEELRTIVDGDTRALARTREECRRRLSAAPQAPSESALDDGGRGESSSLLGRYWWIIAITTFVGLLIVFGRSWRRGGLLTPPPDTSDSASNSDRTPGDRP